MTNNTSWTQANLTAIEQAIAQGVLTVEFDGRRVTYQSVDAMFRVRSVIQAALGVTFTRQTRVEPKTGF
jgi:uncharacterized membrane protein (DUF441 family)